MLSSSVTVAVHLTEDLLLHVHVAPKYEKRILTVSDQHSHLKRLDSC
jgi:hypothetical protein